MYYTYKVNFLKLAIIYEEDCWALDRKIDQTINVAEIKEDKMRNKYIRINIGLVSIVEKNESGTF